MEEESKTLEENDEHVEENKLTEDENADISESPSSKSLVLENDKNIEEIELTENTSNSQSPNRKSQILESNNNIGENDLTKNINISESPNTKSQILENNEENKLAENTNISESHTITSQVLETVDNDIVNNLEESCDNNKSSEDYVTGKQSPNENTASLIKDSAVTSPVRVSPRENEVEVTRKLSSTRRQSNVIVTARPSVSSARRGSTARVSQSRGPPPNSPASSEHEENTQAGNVDDQRKKVSFQEKSSIQIDIKRESETTFKPEENRRNSQIVQRDSIKDIIYYNNENERVGRSESINKFKKFSSADDETPRTTMVKTRESEEIKRTSVVKTRVSEINEEVRRDSMWTASDDTPDEDYVIEIQEDPTTHWVLPPPGSRLAQRTVAPNFFIAKKNEFQEQRERAKLQEARDRQARRIRAKSRFAKQRHMQNVAKHRDDQMTAWRRKREREKQQLDQRFREIERRKQQQIRRISRRRFAEMQQRIAREHEAQIEARRRRIEEEALFQWFRTS